MRAQATYMREELAEVRKSADAATKSAEAAESSANTARRALEITEVPELCIESIKSTDAGHITRGSYITAMMRNTGRTRAVDVIVSARVHLTGKLPRSLPTICEGFVVPAAQPMPLLFPQTLNWLHDSEFVDIETGATELSLEIGIQYRDIFENAHSTEHHTTFRPNLGFLRGSTDID